MKERVELYLYTLSGPVWPVLGGNLPSRLLVEVSGAEVLSCSDIQKSPPCKIQLDWIPMKKARKGHSGLL